MGVIRGETGKAPLRKPLLLILSKSEAVLARVTKGTAGKGETPSAKGLSFASWTPKAGSATPICPETALLSLVQKGGGLQGGGRCLLDERKSVKSST